jgi:hypothetical protein
MGRTFVRSKEAAHSLKKKHQTVFLIQKLNVNSIEMTTENRF